MGTTTREFIAALTENHRVIVIGGLAVIAYGFNRPTKDADVWLEPMNSPEIWAAALEITCEAALANPDPEVRSMATCHLRELADEGDPFSQALLQDREIP